jgi:rubrerythrin
MVDSPELVKISLKLIDDQILVQGVNFSGSHMPELSFDLSMTLEDFPTFDKSSASSHLRALLYEIPDSCEAFPKLEKLTKAFIKPSIALFSDNTSALGTVFLLSRIDDKEGLGSHFSGAKFALFSYNYEELLGNDPKNYLQFIKKLKTSKARFIQTIQEKHSDLEEKREEKKHFEDMAEYLRSRALRLKEELETGRQAISQLKYQIGKKQAQLKQRQSLCTVCIICKSSLKEVVFVPCGHILLCKACMIETLEITPGTSVSKTGKQVKCPSCSTSVKESKIVLF